VQVARGRWAVLLRKVVRALAGWESGDVRSALFFLRSARHDAAALHTLLATIVPVPPAGAATTQPATEPPEADRVLGVPITIALAVATVVLLLCAAVALVLRALEARGLDRVVKKVR
jgi:hypothetical protein